MKRVIAVIIIVIILSFGTGYATSTAVGDYVRFNFLVNGEVFNPEHTPIAISGRSYLPVREIAQLVGYEVYYDEVTNTIVLNNRISAIPLGGVIVLDVYVNEILAQKSIFPSPIVHQGTAMVMLAHVDGLLGIDSPGLTSDGKHFTFIKGDVTADVGFVVINAASYFSLREVVESLGGTYTEQLDGIHIEL